MQENINLYHASSNADIEVFEPRAESVRDKSEGPVVFATPNKAYASCFIVKTDSTWVQISRWGDEGPWFFICSDENRFKALDEGGAIYELENKNFYTDPEKGTGTTEYVSKSPARAISKTVYKSGLEAMIENGVKVLFVTPESFQEIISSEDDGYNIVQGILKG